MKHSGSISSTILTVALMCGAPQTHAQGIDDIYAKAKLEKTLALVAAGQGDAYERRIQEFQQLYPGVTVGLTSSITGGLNREIDQQITDKKVVADLVFFQSLQDFARWKRQGALLGFRPEGFDKIDPAFRDEDGAFTTVSVNLISYAYNTQLIPAADAPKSALDFLKPLFQGKLITTNPTLDLAGLMVFRGIVDKYGWDYMDKYMAQKPSFVAGHGTVADAIAAGDKLATFDSTGNTARLKAAGKPIETMFSAVDNIPTYVVAGAILRDAPHPNAAKLFLNWFMAKEQQSRTGAFSPRNDVAPPQGFGPLSSYKIDAVYQKMLADEAKLNELKNRFAAYLGK